MNINFHIKDKGYTPEVKAIIFNKKLDLKIVASITKNFDKVYKNFKN